MKVYALLSFYDEHPDHLTACVESLAGFADNLIAVDGAYALFPGARGYSGPGQSRAIYHAAERSGIVPVVWSRREPWEGGEVEKRARMFQYGRECGATPSDWFLIIDADMTVAKCEGAREALEASADATADVLWQDVGVTGQIQSSHRFRSLFRALPGLTVKRTHWLYLIPTEAGERYVWHIPDGNPSTEPATDLLQNLTLHHKREQRDPERNERAAQYYQARDAAKLEVA